MLCGKFRSGNRQSGFHLLAPFPGTEIREKRDALGLSILTNDWSQYHANRAIVETPSVNKEMLDELVISWEKKYLDRLGLIKILLFPGNNQLIQHFLVYRR